MRLLLDTHIFLWFILADRRLPTAAAQVLRDPLNEVFLSIISIWEATIKYQVGKLPLPQSPELYLPRQRQRHLFSSLPLDEASIVHLTKLPPVHNDPFDRMLICQALQHSLTVVTIDAAIQAYSVSIL